MTASEAIETLKKMNISFAHPFNEARNKAIEALEKQIAKSLLLTAIRGQYALCVVVVFIFPMCKSIFTIAKLPTASIAVRL